jgi:hypothetical protein
MSALRGARLPGARRSGVPALRGARRSGVPALRLADALPGARRLGCPESDFLGTVVSSRCPESHLWASVSGSGRLAGHKRADTCWVFPLSSIPFLVFLTSGSPWQVSATSFLPAPGRRRGRFGKTPGRCSPRGSPPPVRVSGVSVRKDSFLTRRLRRLRRLRPVPPTSGRAPALRFCGRCGRQHRAPTTARAGGSRTTNPSLDHPARAGDWAMVGRGTRNKRKGADTCWVFPLSSIPFLVFLTSGSPWQVSAMSFLRPAGRPRGRFGESRGCRRTSTPSEGRGPTVGGPRAAGGSTRWFVMTANPYGWRSC